MPIDSYKKLCGLSEALIKMIEQMKIFIKNLIDLNNSLSTIELMQQSFICNRKFFISNELELFRR